MPAPTRYEATVSGIDRLSAYSLSADHPRFADSSDDTQLEALSKYQASESRLGHFPLEIVEVELPPGAEACFPAASYTFRHHAVWVMAGALSIREGEHESLLETGDCLALGAANTVRFTNPQASACRYAVIIGRL